MPAVLDYPLEVVARVLDGRLSGEAEAGSRVVRQVVVDSRQAGPGTLFVALKGEKTDGHQYAAAALEAGCVGVLAAPARLPVEHRHLPGIITVKDPLRALGAFGAWHRNRFPGLRVVAITGSVGKTTTKDLTAATLSRRYTVLKTQASMNAEVGLPLTLLNLTEQHQVAVLEMAMRGTGQIRDLARIARPEIGVITNIGLSHLELLGSQQAIAAAKAELLDFLPRGGVAVLGADDAHFPFLRGRVPADCATHLWSMDPDNRDALTGMYRGLGRRRGSEPDSPYGARFDVRPAGSAQLYEGWAPVVGAHNVRNALAAVCVAVAMGVSWKTAVDCIATAEISAMRSRMHPLPGGGCLVDDAYNASSPETMCGALDLLRELPQRRKVAVLGSMLELGTASDRAHRTVGEAVAELGPDLLVTVGKQARLIADTAVKRGLAAAKVHVVESNDDALALLKEHAPEGSAILVKGSRGMAMEAVVKSLLEAGGSA